MIRAFGAALVLVLSAAACSDSTAPPDEFTVSGAWARPTPSGATNGVVYLTVVADIDDAITGVSVPTEVAGRASLHATMGGDDGGGHHGGGSGEEMTMEPVESIPLTAGDTFEFAPGQHHVMLEELAVPLGLGQRFTLTLELASGRSPTVEVVVADNPPSD